MDIKGGGSMKEILLSPLPAYLVPNMGKPA